MIAQSNHGLPEKSNFMVKGIATLKTTRPANGTAITTACYRRPGDNGGAYYIFDAFAAAAGNDMDIIEPLTGKGPGRWIMKIPCRELLVTCFGAVGDGKKDNTAILQSAINYCAKNKIHAVIPAGIFLFDAAAGIGLNYPTGMWLEGTDNRQSILKAKNYKGQGKILIGRNAYGSDNAIYSRIVCKNFTLDGGELFAAHVFKNESSVKDSLQQMMLFFQSDSILIEKINFINGGAGGGIGLAGCRKVHIQKNSFNGLGKDCINANGYDTSNQHIYIEDNNMQSYAARDYWEAGNIHNWRNGDAAIQAAGSYWWIQRNRAKNTNNGLWFWLEARWTATGHVYIQYNHLDANGRRAMGFSSGGDLRYGGFLVNDHHIDHNEITNVQYGKNYGLSAADTVAGVQKYFVGSYNEVGRCGYNSSFSYNRLTNSPVAVFLSHDYTIANNIFYAPDIDGGGPGAKYLVEFGRQTSGTTDTTSNIYFTNNKGFLGNGVLYHFNRGEVLQHIVIDHNNISLNTSSTHGATNLAFFAKPNGRRRHTGIIFSNNIFSGHNNINPAFQIDLNQSDTAPAISFINNDFRATNITSKPLIYNYTPFRYNWKKSGNRYSDGKTD